MRSKALQIVMAIAFIYAITYCSSQFDEAVPKEALEAYQAAEGLQQEFEAEKPTDGMEKLKAGIMQSAPELGTQPGLMLGKCPSLDDIKKTLTIAGAGLLATSKAWVGHDGWAKEAVWMVVLITRAAVVDAEAIPHYLCVASVESLPDPDCLLSFEHVGHLKLCDQIANERDEICSGRSRRLCKAATQEHKEVCRHSRAGFQWLQGAQQWAPAQHKTNGLLGDSFDAGDNAATGKPTSQSSTVHGGSSSRAVDGNTTTSYGANSCTHTKTESNPWWRVDLQEQKAVKTVTVTNRGDCCGDRLSHFEVRVGDTDESNVNTKCGEQHSVAQGQTLDVSCSDVVGRYVFVVIPGNSKILSLCEVKVRAGPGMVTKAVAASAKAVAGLSSTASQDKGSNVTAGNCRAKFVRAPYEKELTAVAEAGTQRLGSSNGGTRRRRRSTGPPVVFKPGTPFAVNAIQAPGCGLKFNPCRTTEIKTAQALGGTAYLVQVDRHGCTACPVNYFPNRHYLGDSRQNRNGKVLCTKPKSGPLSLQCKPDKARQMVSKQKGGPLPPISCFVLGYRSSNVLTLGRKKTVLVGIKAICLFSKHVQCLTDTHNKRSCAVSKRVYFRAMDTCMKRVPYCKTRTKFDQCQEFDYTQCTGKTYSTKEQLAQHKDDYCVRTCEDNKPSTPGLTRGHKGGKNVLMFPADSADSARTSDNAIPLTVAEGTEGAEQLLLSIGGSDHGPALKADLGMLIEGPGLCATVGANM